MARGTRITATCNSALQRVQGGASLLVYVLLCTSLIAGCAGEPLPRGGIVIIGPHITETVFALGQGHRVSAVDSFSDYPPEVQELPSIGGYIDPNLERLSLIGPDLLIVAGLYPKVMEFATPRKLPTLVVDMDGLSSIDDGIKTIGAALHCEPEAERLRQSLHAELEAVRAAVDNKARPKVLIITGRSTHDLHSLQTAGGASFLSEIVTCAGGDNVYGDTTEPYFEASKETVVARAPDVVLEFHAGENLNESERAAFVADWHAMPTLPAVSAGRVYLVMESHAMRPGPRIGEIARHIATLLHPEVEWPE